MSFQSSGEELWPGFAGDPRAAAPRMARDPPGLGSIYIRFLAYGSSKFAQLLHARALSRRWDGPLVLSVCPAAVSTAMTSVALAGNGLSVTAAMYVLLRAALGPRPASGEDFFCNTKTNVGILNLSMAMITSRAATRTGLRCYLCYLQLWLTVVFQGFHYSCQAAPYPPESEDIELQDSLYDWSLRAVEAY